jgi:hypothetical protein
MMDFVDFHLLDQRYDCAFDVLIVISLNPAQITAIDARSIIESQYEMRTSGKRS